MSGNLESIKLNHVFEIYVPSQLRSGKEIPLDLRSDALDYVKNQMQEWFGGGTHVKSIPAEGFCLTYLKRFHMNWAISGTGSDYHWKVLLMIR